MPSSSSRWDRDNRQSSRPWSQRSSGGPQYPEIWNRGIRRRESTYHESSYREPEDAEPKEREAGDRDARKQVKIEAPSQQPGVKVKKDSSNDSDGSDDDENDLRELTLNPARAAWLLLAFWPSNEGFETKEGTTSSTAIIQTYSDAG